MGFCPSFLGFSDLPKIKTSMPPKNQKWAAFCCCISDFRQSRGDARQHREDPGQERCAPHHDPVHVLHHRRGPDRRHSRLAERPQRADACRLPEFHAHVTTSIPCTSLLILSMKLLPPICLYAAYISVKFSNSCCRTLSPASFPL